jgi:putative transposase
MRSRPFPGVELVFVFPPMMSGANQVWAYDFVFDACANGQLLKCLTVVDEFTRE